MTQSAYGFVVEHMQDPSGLWYEQVTRQGQKTGGLGNLYAQWFVLYGFRWVAAVGGWPSLLTVCSAHHMACQQHSMPVGLRLQPRSLRASYSVASFSTVARPAM